MAKAKKLGKAQRAVLCRLDKMTALPKRGNVAQVSKSLRKKGYAKKGFQKGTVQITKKGRSKAAVVCAGPVAGYRRSRRSRR